MKKINLITFLLTILFLNSLAESSEKKSITDSLLLKLSQASEDTTKVNLLDDLSFNYQFSDPDEGLKMAAEALALSEKLNWKNGIANSNKLLGIHHFRKSEFDQALPLFSLCLKQYQEIGNEKGIAKSLGNIGNVYLVQSEYPKALKYYLDELKILEKLNEKAEMAGILGNIGIIYFNLTDFPKALEYYNQSLKINQELGNDAGSALTLGNIGGIYADQKDYKKALECYHQSLAIFEKLENKNGVARNYSNIAIVYRNRNEFSKAISNYEKALTICKEIGNRYGEGVNYSNIANVYLSIAKDTASNTSSQSIKATSKNALLHAKAYVDSGLSILNEVGDLNLLSTGYSVKSEIQSFLGDYSGALESFKQHTMFKDSIFNMEKDKKLTQTAMQYEFDIKEAAIKTEQEKKDIRQKNIRNLISLGLIAAIIFSIVVYRQRNKISKARKRSDELLLNILPEEVAEELKANGNAEARQFEEVTVMFTDFKDFTSISEKLTPTALVKEIDTCFKAFDQIITKYNIEKIKTIGDSYMCAGGLPVANTTNPSDVVNAAIEIQQFMNNHFSRRKEEGNSIFEIRIGIHTGPVVAGIVGIKKFAYDIWGDTVNIASRMESSGEAGKVNISGNTYNLVKDNFHCDYRGKVQAKNKGEFDMYFVIDKI